MPDILSRDYSPEVLMEMVEGFERWKDKTGHREFLLSTLKERVPNRACVLDAAVGLGFDAIYLAKQGYRVCGKDIDRDAIRIARENREKAGGLTPCQLPIAPKNWLELDKPWDREGVLCVGNSLTYLFRKRERVRALRNFSLQLREGGILVIDERNYQYMFDHAKDIERGTFEYPGIYALSKNDVHLTPIRIKEGKVRMRAKSMLTGHTLDLKFYPFHRNEMLGLLQETGFRKIEQFSDYVPGFNKNADFYQYVCTK